MTKRTTRLIIAAILLFATVFHLWSTRILSAQPTEIDIGTVERTLEYLAEQEMPDRHCAIATRIRSYHSEETEQAVYFICFLVTNDGVDLDTTVRVVFVDGQPRIVDENESPLIWYSTNRIRKG